MFRVHLSTALSYIRRYPFQALAAVFVLTLTFFVTTILVVLVFATNNVITHFETRPQIIVFLKDDVEVGEVSSFQGDLGNDSRVVDVVYVSKEEAFDIYKESTSYNPLLSELVSPSTFPASLEFSLVELQFAEDVVNEISDLEIVDQVGFTANLGSEDELGKVVNRLRNIGYYVRLGGGIFVTFQILTSLIILLVIIGMRLTVRKGEIEILNLIGATPGFIRSPIIFEAIVYAMAGVFFGWLFALILVLYATPSLISLFGTVPVLPRATEEFLALFGIVFLIEIFIGLFLALTGSILAVSRARKHV